MISPDVGGGFGSKIFAYQEHAVVLWAARALGRPVRGSIRILTVRHAGQRVRHRRSARIGC